MSRLDQLARSIEFLVIEDGLITQHTAYCTGPWDRDTVERHRAAAPMARAGQGVHPERELIEDAPR